jgi:hypothetical protein
MIVTSAQTVGGIYRAGGGGTKSKKFRKFFQIFWTPNYQKWLVVQFKRSNSNSNSNETHG